MSYFKGPEGKLLTLRLYSPARVSGDSRALSGAACVSGDGRELLVADSDTRGSPSGMASAEP